MASLGCHVHYFEIQPSLVNLAVAAADKSSLGDKISFYSIGLSDHHSVMSVEGQDGGAYLVRSLVESKSSKVKTPPLNLAPNCYFEVIK